MCIPPMLAKLADESALTRENYVFEPKLDGIRTICRKKRARLELFNRHCVPITSRYPEFGFQDAIAADECLLDGEIVFYNREGAPDFSELMKIHQRRPSRRVVALPPRVLRYAIFDVMSLDGKGLTDWPLSERKQVLRDLVPGSDYVEHTLYTDDGQRLWAAIQERALEGVIAKDVSSRYESGRRSGAWLKIKRFKTIDCVIVGYSSKKRAVSSLATALYDGEGRLQFIGKVGTGFSDDEIRRLHHLLSKIHADDSPAVGVPGTYRGITWVEPRYVCEVRFLEIGSQGMMRNPSYMGLRTDKSPVECTLAEQLGSTS